ncbi:hypothetical protein [Methylobacterium sp. WSM2598]|uniref:hypothetical protein n=1 Tax=Methylobacterium sp. WSM2598 TaxID=398261 RepID=UPI00036B4BBF|nr:hypothetical protein [Methylobacterium sp. WSM2598]
MAFFVVSQAIFDEGKAAKAAGKTYSDDPYRAGSQDSADWLAGFTADEGVPRAARSDNAGDHPAVKVTAGSDPHRT